MPETERSVTGTTLADRYRVLLSIGHRLVRTLGLTQLYRSIYQETARILEAAGFYVALYDGPTDEATVVFFAERGVERDVEISFRGSDSEVLRTRRGTMVRDGHQTRSLMVLGEAGTRTTRSAISVPLLYEGEVIGAISTQSYEPDAYGEEELELFQAIADLAAVAIVNARHVTELEARRREAERIEEIGRAITSSLDAEEVLRTVTDAVVELLEGGASTVWLLEEDNVRAARSGGTVPLFEGEGWVLTGPLREALVRERRAVIIQDVARSQLVPRDFRECSEAGSLAMVPLVLEDEVAGLLSAAKLQKGALTQEGVDALVRLANQASVALANARLHESLQALSLTDPLTELPNRRHMDIHLIREVAAARRGRDLCIVLFDLDDFKIHNDRLGHVVGDQILRSFGRILLSETRAMNLAARYGGDEFISVLTDLPREGAVSHARRVTNRVAAHPILSRYGLTVSFGLAEFDPLRMSEVEDLIRAADEDLYRTKLARGEDPHSR